MAFRIPPRTTIPSGAESAQVVYEELTTYIAYHPRATQPWTFYELLDEWAGPWGQSGYAIGYGKFYCVQFSTNESLRLNPTTNRWVRNTMVLLQEAIRDYIVQRVRNGTISALTEPELRQAAFDSHPRCYDDGGLSLVIMTEPELLPVIISIPGKEFLPWSGTVGATIKQVLITTLISLPDLLGMTLAGAALPAHTGIFRRSMDMDRRNFFARARLGDVLTALRDAIRTGLVDDIPTLNTIIRRLEQTRFPDQGFTELAASVLREAETRRTLLRVQYTNLLATAHPQLMSRLNQIMRELELSHRVIQ